MLEQTMPHRAPVLFADMIPAVLFLILAERNPTKPRETARFHYD